MESGLGRARASLSSGLAYAVRGFAASAVLALISSILLARLFGVEVVGEAALVLAPQAAMVFLSTVQEQPALVRRLAALPPRDPYGTGLFVVTFGFSMLLTAAVAVLVGVAATWALRGPVGQPDLLAPALTMLAGYVLIWNVSWNIDSVFAANGDGRTLFAVRIHQSLLYIVTLLVAASISATVWAVVAATLASWIPPLLHRVWKVRGWLTFDGLRASTRYARRELGAIVRFGLKMAPGSLAAGLKSESGTWLLGTMAPVAQVGAFNRAASLARRLEEVTWRISEIVMPSLAAKHAAGDGEGVRRVWIDVCRVGVIWLALAAGVGAGAAKPLMAMFGPGFEAGATALGLLMVLPMLYLVTLLQNDLLVAHDRPGTITKLALVSATGTVALQVLLIPPLGATGAAAGLVAGASLHVLIGQFALRRVTGLVVGDRWPLRQRVAAMIAGLVAFGAGSGVAALMGSGVVAIVPAALAGAAAGFACQLVLQTVSLAEFRRLASSVRAGQRVA